MRAKDTLCSVGFLQSESLEVDQQLVSSATFLSFGRGDLFVYIKGKGYTILECFVDLLRWFISHQKVEAIRLPANSVARSMAVLYRFWYYMLDEEGLCSLRSLASSVIQ